MKRSMFLLIFFLAIINLVNAGTYYVDSTFGNDSNNGLSSETAWKTISKVNSISFSPGDSILFKRGEIWNETLNIIYSGETNNPIMFGAYGNGEKPIINGQGILEKIINIQLNAHNIIIEDLKLKNANATSIRGILFGWGNIQNLIIRKCSFIQEIEIPSSDFAMLRLNDPSYLTIENCEFTGKSQGIFIYANYNKLDSHDIYITNNNFHDIDIRGYGRAIRMLTATWNKIPNTEEEGIFHDIYITNNNFSKISGIGIWHEPKSAWVEAGLDTYNIFIENNIFYRVEAWNIDWGPISNRGGLYEWSIWANNAIAEAGYNFNGEKTTNYNINAIQTHHCSELYIEDNTINKVATSTQGDGNGIILDYSTVSDLYSSDNMIIRRNIISGADDTPNSAGISAFKGTNNRIYNNILYGNSAGMKVSSEKRSNEWYNNIAYDNVYGFLSNSASGNTQEVKNNIFINNDYGIYADAGSYILPTSDYNLFFNNNINIAKATITKAINVQNISAHSLEANPLFVSPSTFDFHLQSNSPAIDAGVNVGLTEDYDGNSIVGNPDIGAFEFLSEKSQTNTTPIITNTTKGKEANENNLNENNNLNLENGEENRGSDGEENSGKSENKGGIGEASQKFYEDNKVFLSYVIAGSVAVILSIVGFILFRLRANNKIKRL